MKTKLFLICSVFLFSGFSFAKKLDKEKACAKLVEEIEKEISRKNLDSIRMLNLTDSYKNLSCDKKRYI